MHKSPSSSNFQENNINDGNYISLADISLIIASNLKVIIIIPALLCGLTIVYVVFLAKPIYISTAKIMSSSNNSSISQAAGFAAQFGINVQNNQPETNWVYPEILKSRILARSVLKKKFDTVEFGLDKPLLEILTSGEDATELTAGTLEIIGVNKLIDMVDIAEDIRTAIVTIKINAYEPKLAADINNALIDELDAHQIKYNKTKTSDAKKFIQARIIDTEKELRSAEESLKVFMDRNRRIENSPALQLEQQRLVREVTVLTGVFTTLKQQLETTKIEEVKESNYVIVIDPPELPIFHSKPKKSLIVILAGIIGVCLGVIYALFREYASGRDTIEKEKIFKAKSIFLENIYDLLPGYKK